MPFRGQEFTIDFNGCTSSLPNAGEAILSFKRQETLDAYRALLTNGAFSCLFNGTAIVTLWDPFTENATESLIGEAAIWFQQIMDNDPDGNNQTNSQEILSVCGSSNDTEVKFGDIEAGQSAFGPPLCTAPIGKVKCNDGGSSSGILTNSRP